MKPAPFTYAVARTVEDAIARFAAAEGEAKYIAGGQTLGPMLNLRLTQPDALIDIGAIAALRACDDSGAVVTLGAGIRHAEVEDGRVPDPSAGLMPRAARTLAYRAVRNRGTLGGSVAHADPAAEWPNILTALDAVAQVAGPDGPRTVPLAQFVTGYLTVALDPGEMLTGLAVPRLPPGARTGYAKLCRQAGEFALSMAVCVLPGGGGTARVVLGAGGQRPIVLASVAALAGGLGAWRAGARSEIAAALDDDLGRAGVTLDALDRRMHAATLARSIEDALT
jgi:carbon-monoxide dehydrogenase medium subunit